MVFIGPLNLMINMLWMISCIAAAVTLFYLGDSLLSLVQGRASSTSIVLAYVKTVGPYYKWTNRAWRGVKAGGREAEKKGSWIKRVSCQGHWCGGSDTCTLTTCWLALMYVGSVVTVCEGGKKTYPTFDTFSYLMSAKETNTKECHPYFLSRGKKNTKIW